MVVDDESEEQVLDVCGAEPESGCFFHRGERQRLARLSDAKTGWALRPPVDGPIAFTGENSVHDEVTAKRGDIGGVPFQARV